jgi:hypothetical protein
MCSERNKSSWGRIVESIDGAPSGGEFDRLRRVMSPILRRGIQAQFDLHFEAEQYFSHVRLFPISNEKHGAGPRVTLELRSNVDPRLYISFSNWDIQYQAAAQCIGVMPEEAFPVFTRYLQHLWEETVPEPIPPSLRQKKNYEIENS